jgi:hypothetical protein
MDERTKMLNLKPTRTKSGLYVSGELRERQLCNTLIGLVFVDSPCLVTFLKGDDDSEVRWTFTIWYAAIFFFLFISALMVSRKSGQRLFQVYVKKDSPEQKAPRLLNIALLSFPVGGLLFSLGLPQLVCRMLSMIHIGNLPTDLLGKFGHASSPA